MGFAKAGRFRAVGLLALTTAGMQSLALPLSPCLAQGGSGLPARTTPPAQPAAKTASVTSRALQLAMDGNTSEARELLTTAYKDQLKQPGRNPEVPYFLALFEAREGKLKDAIQHLSEAKELYGQVDSKNFLRLALVSKRLADCFYKGANTKAALSEYVTAMKLAQSSPTCPATVLEEILESEAACYLLNKDYASAEKAAQEQLALAKKNVKADSIGLYQLAWSLLQLSDIYRVSGQNEKLLALKTVQRPLLKSIVLARMESDKLGQVPEYSEVVGRYRQAYVKQLQPGNDSEFAWAASDFRERSMPVIGWKSRTEKPQAVIICVHGLGLENRAFEHSARALTQRGYDVYALDVRGFGSWTQTKGVEELDYDQTIADIANLAEIIRNEFPGLKVFLLGESMGGAIALRAGAQLGNKLDGIISSVPSAVRYQQRKMTLDTALHFASGRKKAFDVGYVANQATSSPELQAKWKSNAKARLQLTPIQLTDFAVFMARTKPYAEKIDQLPVLVVQGLSDKLVKPEGTTGLFEAVSAPDKSLLLTGLSEHLMFETPNPDPVLIDVVDSWLKHHLQTAQSSGNEPQAKGAEGQNLSEVGNLQGIGH